MIRYAITDPQYYSSDPGSLRRIVERVLQAHKIDWILLRDKRNPEYDNMAEAFLALKRRYPHLRFFLHTYIESARRLGAHGIHLSSQEIDRVEEAKKAGLWTVVSTHTLEEALMAQNLGADAITFSPIFTSPGKGKPQGLEKLKEIRAKISIKLIALGGIVAKRQIEAVRQVGADGFASIRYFIQGNEYHERF